jgi:hypothetical protein
MHIAIMQPYFLPYIGYFQLMAAVDSFVIYDTVKYTKRGWINRNRMLRNGEAVMFSLPLRKDSDYLNICERHLADNFDSKKLLNQFAGAYRAAPERDRVMPLLADILAYQSETLFDYLRYSLQRCALALGISTPLVVSSDIEETVQVTGVDRVLSICANLGADRYTNPFGGVDMYRPSVFAAHGIKLRFLRSRPDPYPQGGAAFQKSLSIIDVMMFNPPDRVAELLLNGYDIVEGSEVPDVQVAETR